MIDVELASQVLATTCWNGTEQYKDGIMNKYIGVALLPGVEDVFSLWLRNKSAPRSNGV